MADVKKVIEIDVETLRAQGGLDTFIGSLKETETQSISLKSQLRQLKEQLASLPEGTAEYNRVAQEAGNLSDKIGDINTKVKNLGSDTKGIDTVVQGAQTLSGAFTIASSASALLGVENEDLQQTMLKVESAIGLTVGIQSIANALQKESALVLGITSTATKIQTGLQLAYATAVGISSGAMKVFRIALVSTGIGAIVVALGMLISNFDSIKNVVLKVVPGLAAVGDTIMAIVNAVTDFIGVTSDASREAEAMVDKANQSLKRNKRFLDEHGDQIDDYTKRKIEANDKYNQAVADGETNLKALRARADREIAKADADREAEKEKTRKANQDKIDAENKRISDAEKSKRDAATKKEQDERQAKKDKELADIKKLEDEKRALFEKNIKDALDLENSLNESIETPAQKELREYLEKKKILEDNYLSTEILDKQHKDFIAKQSDDYYASEADKAIKAEAEKKEAAEKAAADKIANEKNIKDALVSLSESTNSTLDNLEALGLKKSKATEGIRKGIALAQIATDSAMALSRALPMALEAGKAAAAVAGPAAPVVGPLVIATSLIGSAATIAKNVANAKKLLSGGSASSSASGGGGGSVTGSAPASSAAPQFNIVGNAGVNQIAQTLGQPQPPIQAYVVAGQVTTAQGLNRNIINNATL
jgi:chromosome segregation ATPase